MAVVVASGPVAVGLAFDQASDQASGQAFDQASGQAFDQASDQAFDLEPGQAIGLFASWLALFAHAVAAEVVPFAVGP